MKRLLYIPALIVAAIVGTTALVHGHANPVRFDPAPGVILQSAPSEVSGWFNSDLRRAEDTFVRVLDAGGDEVQTGEVELSADRRQMSVALQSGLGEGRYVVYWSAVDDGDGHASSGCYTFFVGQAAADEAVASGQRLDGGADCPASGDGHSHDDEHDVSLEISLPEVSDSGDVTMTIRPTNFTVRPPAGNERDPNFGHYHIFLNKVPVAVLTGMDDHGHEGNDDNDHGHGNADDINDDGDVHWYENSYTFTDLEPGHHTVTVVLNYDDHSPLNPPVIATQAFRVEGEGSGGDGGVPVWALALGVVGGLVIGGAGMKLAAGRG